MNDPILQSIASGFTPEYKEFIESGYMDAIAQKLGAKYQLEQPDVLVVRNGFMLYLYFIMPASELSGFFIEEAGIAEATAKALTEDFIADLPSSFTSSHTRAVEELRKEPASSTATSTLSQDELLKK